jgi:hypothetical protein
MTTFAVDTHLFRELGELLVGRDSTALIELIKNAYDADATRVVVYGELLSHVGRGYIRIQDNGIGMSLSEFEKGFLTIASRTKDDAARRYLRDRSGRPDDSRSPKILRYLYTAFAHQTRSLSRFGTARH